MADEATTANLPPVSTTLNAGNLATPTSTAPVVAPPAAAPVAATNPAAPAISQMIPVTPERFQALLEAENRAAKHDAELVAQRAAQQELEFKRLTEKGETEKAMNLFKQQVEENAANQRRANEKAIEDERRAAKQAVDDAERRYQAERDEKARTVAASAKYALDGEMGRALAACNLVPGGADQLAHLWRDQFSAVNDNGTYIVRTSTGQSPAEFAAAQLARPEYAHFVRAQNPDGGTGGVQPGQQSAPSGTGSQQQPEQPKNLGEYVIRRMQNEIAARPGGGAPQHDLAAPMGLSLGRARTG